MTISDINIEISKRMDNEIKNNIIENKKIRLPITVMNKFNYKIGEFIQLRDKWGSFINLEIDYAYKEDEYNNPNKGYITTYNFSKAFIKNKYIGIQAVDPITLGCDPEAFILNQENKIIAAYRFFEKNGQVGHDGLLLEFRPSPSVNEFEVVSNISKLIKRARTILNQYQEGPNLKIVSSSAIGKVTAGFHLHYGLPKRLLGFNSDTNLIASLMTNALDYYVGVPSILPEGNSDNSRRTLKYIAYGKPGQFRLDRKTFEYRLPGGMNLRHPVLSKGLIALGSVVVEDLVSRIKELTDSFLNLKILKDRNDLLRIYPNLPSIENLYAIICNKSINLALNHFEIVKKDVRKMIGYENKSQPIEEYFECIEQCVKNKIIFNNNLELNYQNL